ncbi:MAG TPA: type II toxin-antitoxin system HicB family antitoxin [Bacteroidia bacterium]|nr:type II toxin-antitoxin system HicB family antitoxin [Bacteroidia bacterium]
MKNILEYKNYIATVNYANEDETFYGKIEGINDLVLFEGQSVSELKSSFQEAVIDYLETCKEIGKEPEKVYKGVFNVRVPKSIHKKISEIAIKKGLKLNDLVNKTLKYLVSNEEQVLN